MKRNLLFLALAILFTGSNLYAQSWARVEVFRDDNEKAGLPAQNEQRVVFMGNSITIGWLKHYPEYFEGKSYINRGISAQTTAHMLVRFRPDVIELKPALVVILAGTNDIAEKIGPTSLQMIMDNIISMTELARFHNIKVVLCSVLPAYDYYWNPGIYPAEKIVELNKMIRKYAEGNGIVYLDYYSSMVDKRGGLKDNLTEDGVHPNRTGYQLMEPLTEEAIHRALNQNK